jgi:hypothetical protein
MPCQIMYSSHATSPRSASEPARILVDARMGNKARGVAGVLVYLDDVFLQILEDDENMVRSLVANIEADATHQAVTVFCAAEVGERAFRSWSTAYLHPSPEEISTRAGLPGTATVEDLLAEIERDPDRVPRILVTVRENLAH